MSSVRTTVLTTVAVVGLAGAAQAVPLTTNPGDLSANGPITAVFAFADASDDSQILSVGFGGFIFNNQTDPVGTSRNVGTFTGPIAIQLDNLTQGYSVLTGVTDSGAGGDGVFHADYESDFADFGVGSLSSAAATSIAASPRWVKRTSSEQDQGDRHG